ncbi:MAG: Rieske 2Fe-2S domain-containing protein [Acidimicrobiia bacterium]|nr:Rieske 2Fe-2S domain-containing protein [Acidimicrobiia bacterium]
MSSAQIFALAAVAVAVLAAIGIFAIAFRRGGDKAAVGKLDRRTLAADRKRLKELEPVGAAVSPESASSTLEPTPEPTPAADPLLTRPEVSEEEYGVTRRSFFGKAILTVFGVFLLQFALSGLAFFWPRLKAGAFGSVIEGGDLNEIKLQLLNSDGTVTPFFVPAAQAYIVPFQGELDRSQFDDVVVADGVMALWQRCVHLGCRVPVCDSSQGFECPCHGSKYNFHGEYQAGPAPRNLDRFSLAVSDTGQLLIDTGGVIQTARAKDKTADYPQGPSCLA